MAKLVVMGVKKAYADGFIDGWKAALNKVSEESRGDCALYSVMQVAERDEAIYAALMATMKKNHTVKKEDNDG